MREMVACNSPAHGAFHMAEYGGGSDHIIDHVSSVRQRGHFLGRSHTFCSFQF